MRYASSAHLPRALHVAATAQATTMPAPQSIADTASTETIDASRAAGVGVGLERVTHRYGTTVAVEDVSLDIAPGQLVALLGPSGCGKTTLLRVIAGLLRQSEGHIAIGGQIVDALPPNERGAGIVFQNYALFPHMNVHANVAYGLRAQRTDKGRIDATVERMLKLVRMETFTARYPRELSGGQQQRVALARTLAVSPKVLLLDEPFGALDKNLRLDMQIEVKRLQRSLNITTIMVTHDQEEALSMADRIAVMNQGRVEQFASPEEIYDAPATLFVAGFVGTANLLRGRLSAGAHGGTVELDAGGSLALGTRGANLRDGSVVVAARPEHFRFAAAGDAGLPATIRMILPLGPSVVYELSLANGTPLKVTADRTGRAMRHQPGEAVRLSLAADAPVAVFAT
jgi:putative spermidine/putrescine transport system ATP-binding protein